MPREDQGENEEVLAMELHCCLGDLSPSRYFCHQFYHQRKEGLGQDNSFVEACLGLDTELRGQSWDLSRPFLYHGFNGLIGKGMWPTPGPTICQGCVDTLRFGMAENTPQGQGHGKKA